MIFKNNKVYDVLKWIVITVSPALCVLITGLGLLYDFNSAIITGTISLVTTFIGTLIGVSAVRYQEAKKEDSESGDENGF